MCIPAFAPIGAALLGTAGTAAATGTAAAAAGTMAVAQVAQGALSLGAQAAQAKAQAEMQRRATLAENARYQAQVSAMRQQQAADALRVAQEVQQANRASMEAAARKQVAAGEAGVGTESASYLAEMRDLERQVAEHSFSLAQSQALSERSYEMRARDMGLQTQQNYININRPIDQPDFLGTAMSTVMNVFDTATTINRQQLAIGKQSSISGQTAP